MSTLFVNTISASDGSAITVVNELTASDGIAITGSAKFANEIEASGPALFYGDVTASQGLTIPDDQKLYFGTGLDASIEYDENGTDELRFAGAAVTFEQAVTFDGAVTLGDSISVDVTTATSEFTASAGVLIPDDMKLKFGTGADASFEYDEDGTDTLLYAGASIRISDDTKLEFGTGGDASIEYDEDGTDELRFAGAAVTFEQAATFDAAVTLGNAATDVTTVTGQLTASNGLKVDAGNLVVDENATITGQLSASALQVANKIEADDAGLGGDLGVSGSLTAGQISGSSLQVAGKVEADDAGFGGDVGVSGTMTVTTMTASNGIMVTGSAKFASEVEFGSRVGIGTTSPDEDLHIAGNLKVDGYIIGASPIKISGSLALTGSDGTGLSVTGSGPTGSVETKISGTMVVTGSLFVSGSSTFEVDGPSFLYGSTTVGSNSDHVLTVTAQATASNGLKVDAGNLVVDENATITGQLSASSLQIANKIEADDAGLGGDLGVSGSVTAGQISGSSLQVAGKVEADDAGFGGDVGVSGTMTATTAAITTMTASNGIAVTGSAKFASEVEIAGITTVLGPLTASNDILIQDDIQLAFGTGRDATIEYDEDGTDELRFAGAAVTFEQAASFDGNVTLGADANDVVTVAGELTASLGMSIPDDKKLYFGTGFDASFEYDEDGTDTLLYAGASIRVSDDTKLEFGSGGDASFEYDEDGTDTLLYAGASIRISDDTKLEFGTGGDASFEYDEDGNDVLLYAGANLRFGDDIKLEFGAAADATIEYDEDGTDELRFAGAAVTFEQAVTMDANVTLGDAAGDVTTVTGKLTGSNGLAITGDASFTQNVTVQGDLDVRGAVNTTTHHETELHIADKAILIASGTATGIDNYTAGTLDGAGIYLGASGSNAVAKLIYDEGNDAWSSSVSFHVSGSVTAGGRVLVDDTTDATSTTDGSLQTDGGLSVAKDGIVGNDLYLLSDSSVLGLGVGKDATLTHDGTTGLTIAATPISIDATGELHLNSTTGDIKFQDGGADQLALDLDGTSGDIIMKLMVDSDDFVFQQYDGTEVFRVEDNGDFDIAGGLGSTGVTVSAAGAISADGRIITDDATDATSTTDGSIQTDGGLSVAKDVVGGNDLLLLSDAAAIKFGTNSDIVLTHEADRGLILTQGTETTAEPVFTIKNTGDLASGGGIEFVLDNGAGEGDDDILGFISFKGDDSGNAETQFAQMSAIASDITNADEGGKFKFEVMAGGIAGTAALTEVLSIGGEDQANSTNCEVVVNEGGAGFVDFRVEGDDETHLLFVDAGTNAVSIGDSTDAPRGTLEVTNHASSGATGRSLVQLNNNDVDQIALEIVAPNTTADVLSITADDSLTTGNALFIDHNDASTSAVTPVTVHLDFDKDGVTGDGVTSGYTLMDLDMNDGATNHANATVQMIGLDLDITSANAQGTCNNFGIIVDVSGGDVNMAAQLTGNSASQTAVSITNSGNNANRFGLLIQAGTNSISGTPGSNIYAILKSGDGSATNGIIVNSGASDGNVAFAASSDERLKRDIAPTKVVGLDVLNKIEISEFRWKKDGSGGPLTKVGFVAQNCEEVYPEMVAETGADLWTQHGKLDHDVKTVSPSELIPVMVKAIQELSASNKALASKIEELEQKLS